MIHKTICLHDLRNVGGNNLFSTRANARTVPRVDGYIFSCGIYQTKTQITYNSFCKKRIRLNKKITS